MPDPKLSILIADDHELVRKGLRHFLDSLARFDITEAPDGLTAYNLICTSKPAIAILDVQMPGMTGLEIAAAVSSQKEPVKIILLTMFKDESAFNRALDSGVRGYILKENTVNEILDSINRVLEGGHYVSPALNSFLVNRTTRQTGTDSWVPSSESLTNSEIRVLKLLATMKTNQEIAEDLSVSIKTIHNHRNNICVKLGLRGTHALLKYAIENANRY
ncbi:MAG: response regulator transcription factor [Bacteroidetes bacterium]|nr:response regulator transcription factor [Bacteroidota bacterium]